LLTFSAKRVMLRLGKSTGRWLRQIDHLTVPSESEAIHYSRTFGLPSRQVSVCHLGAYDLRAHLPPAVTRPDAQERSRYLFSGGRTDRDYATLFDAVAGSGVRTIVNTRPYIVRGLRAPDEVKVNDLMSGAEYAVLVAYANAVIVPLRMVNHAAGLSMVLDAMALGRPVICSAIPAVRDYVVDGVTGILVPPGNVEAMRAAIAALYLDFDLSEEMGRAARARYEERFTFPAFALRVPC
jgi:glycosyltransferase involved in cell wall biosynthesis